MSNCSILLQDHLIAAGSSCFLFFVFFTTKMNPVVKWILMQSIGSRIGHIPDLKSLRCSWEILKARILLGDPLSNLFMDMILRDFLLIVPLLFLLLSFTVSKNKNIELKALLNTKSLHTSVDQSSNVLMNCFQMTSSDISEGKKTSKVACGSSISFISDASWLKVHGLGSDNHQWDSTQRWSCKTSARWRVEVLPFQYQLSWIFERLRISLEAITPLKKPCGMPLSSCSHKARGVAFEGSSTVFFGSLRFSVYCFWTFSPGKKSPVSKITAGFYYIGEPLSTGIHRNGAWKLKAVTKKESTIHSFSQAELRRSWWSDGWSGGVCQ